MRVTLNSESIGYRISTLDGRDRYVQSDRDFPGLARDLGASFDVLAGIDEADDIAAAIAWLDKRTGRTFHYREDLSDPVAKDLGHALQRALSAARGIQAAVDIESTALAISRAEWRTMACILTREFIGLHERLRQGDGRLPLDWQH